MIANGRVRGALPALGQPKTPATMPLGDRLGKEVSSQAWMPRSNDLLALFGLMKERPPDVMTGF